MKDIKVEKLTLNIGTGGPGDKLEKAMKLLNIITNKKPVATKTKKRIPEWGIRPGLQIGCKVTIRGNEANLILKKLFSAINNKIDAKKFDDNGNFSFGIKEYLDIPEVKYNAEIGIIGLEAAVTLEKPGFRVKKRMLKRSRIHKRHLITKDDAMEFIKNKFNVEVNDN